MKIIDASTDKEHFFVKVTDDGRILYARKGRPWLRRFLTKSFLRDCSNMMAAFRAVRHAQ